MNTETITENADIQAKIELLLDSNVDDWDITLREVFKTILVDAWENSKRPGFDSDWRYILASHFKQQFPEVNEENWKELDPLFKKIVEVLCGVD